MKTQQSLFIIFFFFLPKFFLYGQIGYDYPVKPGTKEWKRLENHKEKVEACQIPVNILFSLSTEELLDACLGYPLVGDIMAFNNVQAGFNSYKTNFNGVNELLQREDFSDVLLKSYSSIEPSNYKNEWTNIEKGEFAYKIIVLELFIAQDEVLQKLENKKDIIALLLLKKQEKNAMVIYDYHSIMSIYYAISKILISEDIDKTLVKDELFSEIVKFSKDGNLRNIHLIPEIDKLIISYNKNH